MPARRDNMTEPVIHIRPARTEDARMLWMWRNNPEVRAASLSTEVIPYESHLVWFTASMADASRDILIAEQDSHPIGMVRFDTDGEVADINILLDPQARSRGLAKLVLSDAIAFSSIDSSRLRATVKAENVASIRLFQALEFQGTKAGDVYVFERLRDSAP